MTEDEMLAFCGVPGKKQVNQNLSTPYSFHSNDIELVFIVLHGMVIQSSYSRADVPFSDGSLNIIRY
jgi:hypothetical protein